MPVRNRLFCGDNLEVMRRHIPDNCIDLVYIDPPFNSKRNYNIFFDDADIQVQRIAFEDTWSYQSIQDSLSELETLQTDKLHRLLKAYQEIAPAAFPYLVMMTLRFIELHRVLKPTGSFYLHCDATMSHYLKTICDAVFNSRNFQNEIIWARSLPHGNVRKTFGRAHDTIFFYTKSEQYIRNPPFAPHRKEYIKQFYKTIEEKTLRRYQSVSLLNPNTNRPNLTYEWNGHTRVWKWTRERMEKAHNDGLLVYSKTGIARYKNYLDQMKGTPLQDIWDDVSPLMGGSAERLGYPTQKPKALLERIISASTNEDDIVLDAFCGCGTTLDAAEGLHRRWVGIDISPVAVSLMESRLKRTYKSDLAKYEVGGIPETLEAAEELWKRNAFAFQDWWLMQYQIFSATFGSKGADQGLDGLGLFAEERGEPAKVGFQVKGGKNIKSGHIDELLGAMVKFRCLMGVFLTTTPLTTPMLKTIAGQGSIEIGETLYPRLQFLTLEQHFQNLRPKLPPRNLTFKQANFVGKNMQYQLPF